MPRRRYRSAVAYAAAAVAGLALFIGGDLTSHRTWRIVGVIVVTLALVLGAVRSALRGDDHE